MDITFEYVGQGDCIVFEWSDRDGKDCIGVVDCNRFSERANPVLQRLKSEEYNRVEFVILSHPHADHYSGLVPVLAYCEQNQIPIGILVYTTREILPFIETMALTHSEGKTLVQFFNLVRELEERELLENRANGSNNLRSLQLTREISLDLLAPSEADKDEFARSVYKEDGETVRVEAKPDANRVSAITRLQCENWQILLTSDSEREMQRRVGNEALRGDFRSVVIAQIPHHGSEKNFYRPFWNNLRHEAGTPAPVSFGTDNRFDHPSERILDEIEDLEYEVHTTGALSTDSSAKEISTELDLFSERSQG